MKIDTLSESTIRSVGENEKSAEGMIVLEICARDRSKFSIPEETLHRDTPLPNKKRSRSSGLPLISHPITDSPGNQ